MTSARKSRLFYSKRKRNKTVTDNRLLAPSRNDPLVYNIQPRCGVALPVAGAPPRLDVAGITKITKTMKTRIAVVSSLLFAAPLIGAQENIEKKPLTHEAIQGAWEL